MSLVGYARVSSTDQDLTVQEEQLTAAGCEKIFAEKISGSSTQDRERLEACLEYCREGDVLLITRLDRLARSLSDLTQIILRLEKKGVGFRCTEQSVDTTSPEGRLMVHIMGAFAEFELEIRKDRQREGIDKAKKAGVYVREEKVSANQILALRARGLGAQAIARELKIAPKTVYRKTPGIWGADPIPR